MKKITKAIVFQRLADILGMQEYTREDFLFEETIRPVLDIRQYLSKWSVLKSEEAITGTGWTTLLTAKSTERLHIRWFELYPASGAYEFQSIFKYDGNTAQRIMIYNLAAAATFATFEPNQDLILEPGQSLRTVISTYTSPGDLYLYYDVLVENLR